MGSNLTGAFGGALSGALIGATWGGWLGAGLGAVLGGAVGLVGGESDTGSVEEGAPQSVVSATAEEGAPIYDLLGCSRMAGNIIWVGEETRQPADEEGAKKGEGKGGGGDKAGTDSASGYEYYRSWAVALCEGPVDALFTVYQEDEVVWEGVQERPAGGVVSLTLNNMGLCRFYFGTPDQPGDELMSGDDHPDYRRLCYAVFDNVLLGSYPKTPTVRFTMAKQPAHPEVNPVTVKISYYDYNPALAVYHLLTAKLGLPETYLNLNSFFEASETLRAEILGVSILFDRQRSAQDYLSDILTHINAALRYEPEGRFRLVLMRRGADADSLPVVDQDDLTEDLIVERRSWLDTINELKVDHILRTCRTTDEDHSGLDGDSGNQCPAAVGISYSSPTMNLGAAQSLSSADGVEYEWSIRTGGGSLNTDYGSSVVFTAPDPPTEYTGAVIDLLCCGVVLGSLNLTFVGCVPEDGILLSSQTQPCGSAQLLQSAGGAAYTWRIASGGGTLSRSHGASTTLTAPAANPDCASNAVVEMVCYEGTPQETVLDSVEIAFNCAGAASAYLTCDCDFLRFELPNFYYYYHDRRSFTCDDTESVEAREYTECYGHHGSDLDCTGFYRNPAEGTCVSGGVCEPQTDLRTSAAKQAGCCPHSLWGL